VKYKRWIMVAIVAALAIFSFYHLSTAGTNYKISTTSDSGYFYGIARQMNEEGGIVDHYDLSRPPGDRSVGGQHQFQPLVLTTMYRGLNSVFPNVGMEDAHMYFSPIIFSIAVIGAFLAGRELGGNVGGAASALFFATMVGSIYWTKIGAFDRPIMQTFFGVWLFYGVLRVLNSEGTDLLKNVAYAGILFGMFLVTWTGSLYFGAILGATLFLIITEKAVDGLGFTITGIGLLVAGASFSGFGIVQLIGLFTMLAGIVRIARDRDSLEIVEKKVYESLRQRNNYQIIGGLAALIGISTIIALTIGDYDPSLWVGGLYSRIAGFVGIGSGGGAGAGTVATEQASSPNELIPYFSQVLDKNLYRNGLLTGLTGFFVLIGLGKTFRSTKRTELFAISWFFVATAMPIAQARFGRLLWSWWPILAGFGVGVLFDLLRDRVLSSSFSVSSSLSNLRKPLVVVIIFLFLVAPFVSNVRAESNASKYYPPPHGGSLPKEHYNSLLGSFEWIRENTPKDSIVAVRWSYGHFATGASERRAVCDGAQRGGWKDEWRNSHNPPPDYIRFEQGDEVKRYGSGQTPSRKFKINGRRPDMRNLVLTEDEEYFKWILNTYRENFDIPINHIVFNDVNRRSAIMAMMGIIPSFYDIDTEVFQDFSQQDMTFYFEDTNVRLMQNPQTKEITVMTENGKTLTGFGIYNPRARGIANYSFNQNADVTKFLTIIPYENQWRATLNDVEGVPMTIRALNEDMDIPEYVEEVHREPRSVVWEVNHEELYGGSLPSLNSPVGGESISGTEPELSWTGVGGAERYELEISKNPSFSDQILKKELETTQYELSSEESLSDGEYHWRVKAYDAENESTAWSSSESFIVDSISPLKPDILSPMGASIGENEEIVFSWEGEDNKELTDSVSGIGEYQIQCDNDSDFSSPMIDRTGIEKENLTSEEKLSSGEYWWRVRAIDRAGNYSTWSESAKFDKN